MTGSLLKSLYSFLVSVRLTLAVGEPIFRLLGRRRGQNMPALSEVQRILVLRLDQIGDLVMTTPFLRELRKNAPQAHITLVVKPSNQELAAACPYVDEVLTFDGDTPLRFQELRRRSRALKFCRAALWRKRFDLAVIPRWDVDMYYHTFLAYLSGARWRIGYSEDVNPIRQEHNRGYDRLMTQVLHQSALCHEVERSLNVLRALGGTVTETDLALWSEPLADDWARDWLSRREIAAGRSVIAFGPFVGGSSLKKWPLENFVELGRWLTGVRGSALIVIGGPGDQDAAQRICDEIGHGAWTLAGQCTLPQTAALLKRCFLYVGDDSGPMHLASAAGIPVVALFGPSCPHRFGPWTLKKEVLWKQLPCSPCTVNHHADCCSVCIFPQPLCIQSITVEEVKSAIEESEAHELPFPYLRSKSNRLN